ncbi:hypothetical protein EJB05_44310, partial [Eragrostis curvula]
MGHGSALLRRAGSPALQPKDATTTRQAQGRCEAFTGEGRGVDHYLIRFLSYQAPLLKSLILVSCCEVSHRGLLEAIERFPLLRELEVTACPKVCKVKLVEVVAMACPRNDREATAISRMREIRSLQVVYSELSNQGLSAILDNCPHLESLDVRRCRHIIVDEALRDKCARINSVKLLLHERDDDDYCEESELPSPISECSTCYSYFEGNQGRRY